jgi:hypothetical protein
MTYRDINIIATVYDYEGCGVEHIRKLFFQGATSRSIPCYRRIAYLVKEGYLRSLLLPALNKHFISPGTKARTALAHLLKGSAFKRLRVDSPLLILHKLAICDVRVSLELASKASLLFLLTQWVNESTLRRSPLVVADTEAEEQSVLVPDAAFTLLCAPTGGTAGFYLEMDLATVSLKSIRRRVRGYLLRRRDPSRVLFVVPDAKRQEAIAQVALEEARLLKANPTIVWITQQASITPETVLSAPWTVVGAKPLTFQGLAGRDLTASPTDAEEEDSAIVFAKNGGQLE